MTRTLFAALAITSLALAAPAHAAGDAAAGKAKAGSCAMCHGPAGQGTAMGPKLAGADPAKFTQDMNDYKSGKKSNAMMKSAATPLSADDIANLAAYYATLK
jgi:cytochrome c553